MGIRRSEHLIIGIDFKSISGSKSAYDYFEDKIDSGEIDEDYIYEMEKNESVYFIEDYMSSEFSFFGVHLAKGNEYEGFHVTEIQSIDFYNDTIELIIEKAKTILNLDVDKKDVKIYVFTKWS